MSDGAQKRDRGVLAGLDDGDGLGNDRVLEPLTGVGHQGELGNEHPRLVRVVDHAIVQVMDRPPLLVDLNRPQPDRLEGEVEDPDSFLVARQERGINHLDVVAGRPLAYRRRGQHGHQRDLWDRRRRTGTLRNPRLAGRARRCVEGCRRWLNGAALSPLPGHGPAGARPGPICPRHGSRSGRSRPGETRTRRSGTVGGARANSVASGNCGWAKRGHWRARLYVRGAYNLNSIIPGRSRPIERIQQLRSFASISYPFCVRILVIRGRIGAAGAHRRQADPTVGHLVQDGPDDGTGRTCQVRPSGPWCSEAILPIFGWYDNDSLEVDYTWPLEIKAKGYADQFERMGALTRGRRYHAHRGRSE